MTRRLSDGDILDLGDRQFRVVHLPGHSPGSINLLDVGSDRSLFSGDVVYESESGNAGDEAWNNAFVLVWTGALREMILPDVNKLCVFSLQIL